MKQMVVIAVLAAALAMPLYAEEAAPGSASDQNMDYNVEAMADEVMAEMAKTPEEKQEDALEAQVKTEAEEAAKEPQEPASFSPECLNEMKEVAGKIRDNQECWMDKDCLAVRFGCPWEPPGCQFTILSNESREKLDEIVRDMAAFEAQCVQKTPGMRARCDALNHEAFSAYCPAPTLKCLQGKCVTQTHVLIQGDL